MAMVFSSAGFPKKSSPYSIATALRPVFPRLTLGLGDHVLTAELNGALSRLIDILNQAGRIETAAAIQLTQNELALSIGKLRSRASRSP